MAKAHLGIDGIIGLLLLPLAGACGQILRPTEQARAGAVRPFDFAGWDRLLRAYVDDQGRVDYEHVDSAALDAVLASAAASSPASDPSLYPTRDARLAYYIDTYNAAAWKDVIVRLPKLKKVRSQALSFFLLTRFVVGGEPMSLLHIERKVAVPEFRDPRVHMALNCASASCPMLPREAFFTCHSRCPARSRGAEVRVGAEKRRARRGAKGDHPLADLQMVRKRARWERPRCLDLDQPVSSRGRAAPG